jgi:hypothetical protein
MKRCPECGHERYFFKDVLNVIFYAALFYIVSILVIWMVTLEPLKKIIRRPIETFKSLKLNDDVTN